MLGKFAAAAALALSLTALADLEPVILLQSPIALDQSEAETQDRDSMAFNPTRTTTWTSDQCRLCHTFDSTFSHPVGVVPPSGMGVPEDLPLEEGRLTCLTCHDGISNEHASGNGATGGASFGFPLGPTQMGHADGSLCVRCHDPSGSTSSEMHAGAMRRAHLPQSQRGWATTSSKRDGSAWENAIDSSRCLTCHDGAMASDASAGMSAPMFGLGLENQPAHPVSIEYRVSDPTLGEGGLRDEHSLDSRVRLFDRRVECGSCHSPYSSEPRLLVMSNEGSQLCLSCHDL